MAFQGKKIILAIESSCDETAAAVLSASAKGYFPDIKTLSSIVKSQIQLHKSFGGVVPEAAARAHVKNILPVVKQALNDAFMNSPLLDGRSKVVNKKMGKVSYDKALDAVDYIAVTAGPGLIPSLIVGVEFAKALSLATGKPMIPVNHLAGHLYSPLSQVKDKGSRIKDLFPMISLIVSGGHTILVLQKNLKDYRVLGQTADDAAGEAFDKVAKLLGLPYPGGPEVSKLAKKSTQPVDFPRPMINSKDYNFSFAGLKTAVLYFAKDKGSRIKDKNVVYDICAGFQTAAVDVLGAKTMRAAKEFRARSVSISGGVSANAELRNRLRNSCAADNLRFFAPPMHLSTDNAEMIGQAAAIKLHNGYQPVTYRKVKADPNLSL